MIKKTSFWAADVKLNGENQTLLWAATLSLEEQTFKRKAPFMWQAFIVVIGLLVLVNIEISVLFPLHTAGEHLDTETSWKLVFNEEEKKRSEASESRLHDWETDFRIEILTLEQTFSLNHKILMLI